MSGTSRRKLLKSIVAGSCAIVACKSLSDRWSRPVVDSVMLPAHAQTSTDPTMACTPDPITETNQEAVAVIFDGISCSLIEPGVENISQWNSAGGHDPDTMMMLDSTGSSADIDTGSVNGDNWVNAPTISSVPAGTYSYTRTRSAAPNAGQSYQLTFTLAFSGNDMTVSNVSIVQV